MSLLALEGSDTVLLADPCMPGSSPGSGQVESLSWSSSVYNRAMNSKIIVVMIQSIFDRLTSLVVYSSLYDDARIALMLGRKQLQIRDSQYL